MKRFVYTLCVTAVVLGCSAQAATLGLIDRLDAYHAATPEERAAIIPQVFAELANRINRKGKTDAELSAEVLPCVNSVDDQLSDAVRATQPVMDAVDVCLGQLGYKK